MRRAAAIAVGAVLAVSACGQGGMSGASPSPSPSSPLAAPTAATGDLTKQDWLRATYRHCGRAVERIAAAPPGELLDPRPRQRRAATAHLRSLAQAYGAYHEALAQEGLPHDDPQGAETLLVALQNAAHATAVAADAVQSAGPDAPAALDEAVAARNALDKAAHHLRAATLGDCDSHD